MKNLYTIPVFLLLLFLSGLLTVHAQTGKALDFDGTDDFVFSNANIGISGTSDRTIECWVKIEPVPSNFQHIINWGSAALTPGTAFGFYQSPGTHDLFFYGQGGAFDYDTGENIADGLWHHIAATYDGTTVRTYVDGGETATSNQVMTLNTTDGSLFLGIRQDQPTFGSNANMELEEVRVWNRVLEEDEINGTKDCELDGSEEGLILYYDFNQGVAAGDNGSGCISFLLPCEDFTTDSSPSGNDGTLGPFALLGTSSNWIDPAPDLVISDPCIAQVLNFDGTDDIVNCGNVAALDLDILTIEAWINMEAGQTIGSLGRIVDKFEDVGATKKGYYLARKADGVNSNTFQFFFFDTGGTPHTLNSTTAIANNVWTHVAVTYDGNIATIFIDGVEDNSATFGTTIAAATGDDFTIGDGFDGVGNHPLDASLDDIRIWSYERCEDEIAGNSVCELSASEPNLVAYYTFNQGIFNGNNTIETTLTDATGTADGTLSNFMLTGLTSNWTGFNDLTIDGVCSFSIMEVTGAGVIIEKEDDTPSITDDTDFGTTTVGVPISKTFTIQNTGAEDLFLSGIPDFVEIIAPFTDFTVSVQPPGATVFSGGSTTFTIDYLPAIAGIETVTVQIENDHCDPYTFDITALATASVTTGPGGVSTNLGLWLKANAGVTTAGSNVTLWEDQANTNDATQATTALQPTLQAGDMQSANFNPVASFDGIDDEMSGIAGANSEAYYLVILPNTEINATLGGQVPFGFECTPCGITGGLGIGDATTSTANEVLSHNVGDPILDYVSWQNSATDAYPAQLPLVLTALDNAVDMDIYANGLQVSNSNSGAFVNFTDEPYFLGRRNSALAPAYFDGMIAEVISYDGTLAGTDHQQILSYLALKYGVTLDQTIATDYLASDGTTLIWDSGTAGALYDNDIAAIGQDDNSELLQKQSSSINPDVIVTIGLGNIAATNNLNTNTFGANLQFLSWGNDGGDAFFTGVSTTNVPPGLDSYMGKTWQAQENNGDVGNLEMQFNIGDLGYDGCFTNVGNFSLIIDTDTDFSDATVIPATSFVGNIVTFSSVNLVGGNFFTLGFDAIDPDIPTVNSSGNVCFGETATLSIIGGDLNDADDWQWYEVGCEVTPIGVGTTIVVTPLATTSYFVKGEGACIAPGGTCATTTVVVFTSPTAAVTASGVCIGNTATITATGGTTYLWSTGSTSATITDTPTANTSYNVTVTDLNGCTDIASATITVNPLPTVTAIGDEICVGNTAFISVIGGSPATTYIWSTGETAATISDLPTSNNNYFVTVTDGNSCTGTASAEVTVNTSLTVTATGDEICVGNVALLSAEAINAVSYLWSTGATTQTINDSPTSTVTYAVTVTDVIGCVGTATTEVTVNTSLTVIASGDEICSGETALVSADGGTATDYLWSTGNTTDTFNTSPTTNTIYTVTASDAVGCMGTATTEVTVNPPPSISATGQTVCPGNAATVTATGALTYSWSTGDAGSTITVTPTTTTTYIVTATDALGCTNTASTAVTVGTLMGVAATGNSVCEGNSASISATGGTGYVWSTGDIGATISVLPVINTIYTVTVTDGLGCSGIATTEVTVNGLPIVSFSGFNLISQYCETDGIVALTGSPIGVGGVFTSTATGLTDNLDGTATFDPSLTGAGSFDVIYTFTDGNGCADSQTQTVSVNALPLVSFSGFNLASQYCETDGTVILTGTPIGAGGVFTSTAAIGFTDNLDNTGTFDPTLTGTGSFDVTYTFTDGNGCTDSQTQTVAVNALPIVSFSGFNVGLAYCETDGTVILTGTPIGAGGVFTSTAAIGFTDNLDNTATFDPTLTGTGSFDVTYTFTDGNGCTDSQTQTVAVNALPIVSFSGFNAGLAYCETDGTAILTGTPIGAGGVFTSTATTGFTDNLDGTANFDPSLTGTGSFDVIYTFTDANGCTDSQTQTVVVNALPIVSFSGFNAGLAYCETDGTAILTGTPIGAGGVFTSTATTGFTDNLDGTANFDPSLTGIGLFDVIYTFTDANGCTDSQTQTVAVNALPIVSFSGFNTGLAYCETDGTVILTGTPIGAGGVFTSTAITGFTDNLDNTATFDSALTGTGSFDVTYTFTDGIGCTDSETQTVAVNALPIVSFSGFNGGLAYCQGDGNITLTGSPLNGVFTSDAVAGLTDNLDGTAIFAPTLTGNGAFNVIYTFTDGNGCMNSQTQTVTINPLPNPVIDALQPSYCIDNGAILITATPSNGTFTSTAPGGFNDNGNGNGIFVPIGSGAGAFNITYTVTDGIGCTNSTTETILINPLPTLTFVGTSCATDLLTYEIVVESNTTDLITSEGTITDNLDGSFTIGGIAVGNNVAIEATDADGECATSLEVNAPNCDCPIIGVPVSTVGAEIFYCELDPIPTLSVTIGAGLVADWYDAPIGGNLLLANNTDFTPTTFGTYYAEARDPLNACVSSVRVQIIVTELALPIVDFTTLNGSYCNNEEPVSIVGSPLNGVFTSNIPTGLTDDGAGNATLDPSLTGEGTFSITYTFTDGNGCINSSTQTINIVNIEDVSFAGLAASYCENDASVLLTGFPLNGAFAIDPPEGLIDNGDGTATFDPSLAAADTYEITYIFTNGSGCEESETQSITVNTLPTINLLNLATDYCEDDGNVLLEATPTNGVFSSNAPLGALTDNGDGTASFNPSTAGDGAFQISYTFTDNNGCTGTITQTTMVHAFPILTLSGLLTDYCEDSGSIPLEGTPANGTFSTDASNGSLIDNNDGTATFNPSVTGEGDYQVTYIFTDEFGCTNTISQTVDVHALPTISLLGLAEDYCADDGFALLNATPANGDFSSNAPFGALTDNGNGTATFNPGLAIEGEFQISYTFTDGFGCVNSITQTTNVHALPNVDFSGLASSYCLEDGIVALTGTPSNGVFVIDPPTAGLTDNLDGTATLNPTIAWIGGFDITYTFTDENGCMNAVSQPVSVFDLPTITLVDTVCVNTLLYDAFITSNASDIEASEGIVINNGNGSFTIEGITAGNDLNITATSSTDNCSSTLLVTAPDCDCAAILPPVSGGDAGVCIGEALPTLSVTVEVGETADWYDAPIGGTLLQSGSLTFAPTGTGTFYAEARNLVDGCVSATRTAVALTIFGLPVVDLLGLDDNYCRDDGLLALTGVPANGIFSSNNGTDALIDNGDGTATFDTNLAPIGDTQITYAFTDGNGCINSIDSTTTVSLLPTLQLEEAVCDESLATYDLIISTNASLNEIVVSDGTVVDNLDGTFTISDITAGVDLTVDVVDAVSGCASNLFVNAPDCACLLLNPPLSEGDAAICADDPTIPTLSVLVGENQTADWYDAPTAGSLLLEGSLTYTPTEAADFYAEARLVTNGCVSVSRTEVSLAINPLPNVNLVDLDSGGALTTDYCLDAALLNIGAEPLGGTFGTTLPTGFADNGDGTATVNVNEAGNGDFVVLYTFTDGNNCSATEVQNLSVNALPDVSIGGLDNSYCEEEAGVLNLTTPQNAGVFSTTASTGLTDNGDGTADLDLESVGVDAPFEVTYSFTDANNCTDSETINVVVNAAPDASFTGLVADYCSNDGAADLSALVAGGSFNTTAGSGLIDNGDGTANFAFDEVEAGSFEMSYTLTNVNNCTDTETVAFTVNAAPDASFTELEEQYCMDIGGVVLTANQAGGAFSMDASTALTDNGDGTADLNIGGAEAGDYQVSYDIVSDNGCVDNETQAVRIDANPMVELMADGTLCTGTDTLELNEIGGEAVSWSWTGPNDFTYDLQSPILTGNQLVEGVYNVQGTNGAGCVSTASIDLDIALGQSFLSNLLIPSQACVGDTIHFIEISETNIVPSSFYWEFGNSSFSTERDPVHVYSEAGSYLVNVEVFDNECGNLSLSKTINIVNCRQSLIPTNELVYVNAYPNPSQDGVFLLEMELAEEDDVLIQVYDEQGRLAEKRILRDVKLEKEAFQLNHSGVYFIHFQSIKLNLRKSLKVVVGR